VSQHLLREEMSKTPRKIYTASSNSTSSSRLCKSLGDLSHCKNLFGKANPALLLATEEIYGSSLQRSELFLHLRFKPCKRRLKDFTAFKTLIVRDLSVELVKRFMEGSIPALRSLKTSKASKPFLRGQSTLM